MCGQIEFYEMQMVEGIETSVLLACLITDAPPPPVDAKLNMKSTDYVVELVDYSIDAPYNSLIYRRNVWLKKA